MGKYKRKRLPKEFEELLAAGDLGALKAVFDACDVDARGGYAKQTALAFDDCPDDLARWLVEQGADLHARDTWGNTPLHSRARSHFGRIEVLLELGADVNDDGASIGTPLHAAAHTANVQNAALLLERGAVVDGGVARGRTPLAWALCAASNATLSDVAPFAELLIESGAEIAPEMREQVRHLGEQFEFYRENFNPEIVDEADSGLRRLYELFEVTPVPPLVKHDGTSAIKVKRGKWQDQHDALWQFLVPASGPADTVQGELIRLTGRIAHEHFTNGNANWDQDFDMMARAVPALLRMGTPLPKARLSDADLAAELLCADLNPNFDHLLEAAVTWVKRNPEPIPLPPPDYRR